MYLVSPREMEMKSRQQPNPHLIFLFFDFAVFFYSFSGETT